MNWIESNNLEDVLVDYMAKLALDLAADKDISLVALSESEAQEIGAKLTEEWMSGKSEKEKIEFLLEKYGTEEHKKSYNEWLLGRA